MQLGFLLSCDFLLTYTFKLLPFLYTIAYSNNKYYPLLQKKVAMKKCLKNIVLLWCIHTCIPSSILPATTVINSIPTTGYVINKPGRYTLNRNLVYQGRKTAIRINANNVELDFNKFSLRLTREEAVGIVASNVKRVNIHNGTIFLKGETPTTDSIAIHYFQTTDSNITNFSISNTYFGIIVQQSTHTAISNYSFINSAEITSSMGLSIRSCRMVTVDQCSMRGTLNTATPNSGDIIGIGINPASATTISRTIAITNCQFPGIDIALEAIAVDGLLVSNCIMRGSLLVSSPIIRLGSSTIGCNDTIIQNCSLTKPNTAESYSGIFLENGTGCLISNTIIDTNAQSLLFSQRSAALRIGRRNSTDFKNVTIRDSIIQGNNQYGILAESASGMVIENSTIKQANSANIFLENTTSSTIANSLISESAKDGIVCSTGTTKNNILTNTISNNTDNGIKFEAATTGNLLKENNIFGNTTGITELGANQIYFNNSCNNTVKDCIGIAANLAGTPGSTPVTLGQNICCTS